MIFIGRYPTISLATARQEAAAISQRIAQGLPAKEAKHEVITFEWAAAEWLDLQKDKNSESYCHDVLEATGKAYFACFR